MFQVLQVSYYENFNTITAKRERTFEKDFSKNTRSDAISFKVELSGTLSTFKNKLVTLYNILYYI